MSSPPHVIPVMHPGAGDSDGLDLIPKDHFEGYGRRDEVMDQVKENSERLSYYERCRFKSSPAQGLESILHLQAEKTLKTLSKRIDIRAIPLYERCEPNLAERFLSPCTNRQKQGQRNFGYTYKAFWSDEVMDEDNFGAYGIFADNFGKRGFEIDGIDEKDDFKIYIGAHPDDSQSKLKSEEFFDNFVFTQYRQAVEATKEALYWGWLQLNQ